MIIKIMPENDIERQRIQAVEHTGVKEFFIFGNKKDKDGDLIDFHDWTGSYRYLEGSLYHFLTTITEEKKVRSKKRNENEIDIIPPKQSQTKIPQLTKRGKVNEDNVQVINVENLENKEPLPPELSLVADDNVVEAEDEQKND